MERSMLQVFVKNSAQALEFYQKAFDAKILYSSPDSNGNLMHSELDVYGQIMAVSELADEAAVTGNTMMFCMHMGAGQETVVQKIYDVLKEDAKIVSPPAPCDYSPLEFVLTDKYGV